MSAAWFVLVVVIVLVSFVVLGAWWEEQRAPVVVVDEEMKEVRLNWYCGRCACVTDVDVVGPMIDEAYPTVVKFGACGRCRMQTIFRKSGERAASTVYVPRYSRW